jgi:hypothetical protein
MLLGRELVLLLLGVELVLQMTDEERLEERATLLKMLA